MPPSDEPPPISAAAVAQILTDADRKAATDERRAILLSLVVGITLMLLKFAAYVVTGSSAVFSDALESIVNVIASGFALWAIGYAHLPADSKHPWGHGKVEFVSAAIEGAMILVAAAVIAIRAIGDLIVGAKVEASIAGVLLLLIAMAVNGIVGLLLVRIGRRSGSMTLEADGHHLLTDAITSVAVLITLGLVRMTHQSWLDPIGALLVGAYIARVGLALVRRSAAGLMDEQDPEDELLLRRVLDAHVGPNPTREPSACSYHKLRHRHSGRYHWVDFHLVVPKDWDIDRAHQVASAIEFEIEQTLEQTDATAHVEPCVSPACSRCVTGPATVA